MDTLWRMLFGAMDATGNAIGRLRGGASTKKKLEKVPTPPAIKDPFAPAAAEAPSLAKSEEPLGDANIPVQVYGKRTDPWSGRVVLLLKDREITHTFVDIDDDPLLESRLVRETKQYQLPYIYVRGEFIGGYNAIGEIDRLGQLEEMIKPPGERSQGGVRIVVPKRDPETQAPGERN